MKCPACDRKLSPMKVGSVMLDVCQDGCGGVWFDATELKKVSAEQRGRTGRIVKVKSKLDLPVDPAPARQCPHCAGITLERRLYSLGTGVEMDCCPQCAGIWLDHGELEVIQEETNPAPQPTRHVVRRAGRSIPIDFNVVQQIEALRIRRTARK
jgi:Zn-finger nucleic acid-binding protein